MANTATNTSVGKPKTSGGVYMAPLGTALPTDASTALASEYVSLGYIAEGGVTNSNSPESEDYKAWGGDTVLSYQTGKDDTFALGLIESPISLILPSGITMRLNAPPRMTISITKTCSSMSAALALTVMPLVPVSVPLTLALL